ncbi:MAG: M1 family aminopeptidase [Cytophagales bacterium]|nr:M1 family aminopeptidase [Cytophagales bacterium]
MKYLMFGMLISRNRLRVREEGLATFIEYLTVEKLNHREYLNYVTNWFLQVANREVAGDKRLKTVPMVDFGKQEMTDYSYSIGMIAFRILYEILGEEKFNHSLRTFYQEYAGKEATTEDFVRVTKRVSGKDMSAFFNDWFFTTGYISHFGETINF